MMKKKGLSLLEVLMASVILALTITGLANIFVATKRLTFHARARVTASELIKSIIEPLQSQVRQDLWGSNCLSNSTLCPSVPWTDATSATMYTPTCVTSAHPQLNTVRKVKVTVQWQERSAQ